MNRAGREPDWSRVAAAGQLLVEAFTAPTTPSPTGPFVTPSGPTPTRRPAAATSEPTRGPAPTATPRPPPTPTSPPPTPATVEYVLTRQELDAELRRAIESGGVPLRSASVRLVPNDRVALSGQLPVAIFLVPVELEARVGVDARGQVQVTTTKVEAVGAALPEGVARSLGSQVDEQGTQAVRGALPPDARARQVRVEAERIVVELAPT